MKKLYFTAIFVMASILSYTQPVLSFNTFLSGLTAPVDIVNARDGSNKLYIVQQNGIVRVYSGGALLTTPFLNMSSLVTYDAGGERGLLSIAFHPQYSTNRYFFVYYNNAAGNGELAQYQTLAGSPDQADPASRKVMLTVTKPYTNHNGCKLNFGPDGNLYLGLGDGGSGGDPQNYSQNLNSYLGKMLRINTDDFTTPPYYTVPATNPLVGVAGTLPEIYSWGLRNPWRWSFDRSNGDMWIADVGQGAWEEINYIPAGATSGLNYGWRCYEGTHTYDLSLCGATPLAGKTFPIFEYAHNAAGGFSVTGGLVYRGAEYPALQGWYICADYVRPNGWLIKSNGAGGWNVVQQTNFPANVVTFGDAEDGTLYASSLGGTIYKVVASVVVPVRLISFEGENAGIKDVLNWRIAPDPSLQLFEIEQSADRTRFIKIGETAAGSPESYSFNADVLPGDRYYRLRIKYSTGSIQYSDIIKISAKDKNNIVAYAISKDQIQLTNPSPLTSVFLLNMQGQRLRSFYNLSSGAHILSIPNLPSGVYYLQCTSDKKNTESVKLFIQ
jgi:glucose/arabinose dehydrogenase